MDIEIKDIQELYNKINSISVDYLFFHKEDIIKSVYLILPELSSFVNIILSEWNMLSEEIRKEDIVEILQDCVQAIEQKDQVLMFDTIQYGFAKIMKELLNREEGRNLLYEQGI